MIKTVVLLGISLTVESMVTVHYVLVAQRWESLAKRFELDDQKSLDALRKAVAAYERCEGLPQRAFEIR